MDSFKLPMTFEIKKTDILRLLIGELKHTIQEGSFFKGLNAPAEAGVSSQYGEIMESLELKRAAALIAAPEAYAVLRSGGGSMPLEELWIHLGSAENTLATAAAVVTETQENFMIQYYERYQDFILSWCQAFATDPEETAPNYIPPKVELEAFLFVLHSIDAFRRATFRNLLDYALTEAPAITFSEFTSTMGDAIRSGDIRWLLPAFMVVTPGLHEVNIDLKPSYASILTDKSFLVHAQTDKPDNDVLVFGEAGRVMGVEFYRTWLQCFGFDLKVKEGSKGNDARFKTAGRLFVAPTALANHLVSLEMTGNGRAMVNHQAYMKEQLVHKLNEVFEAALKGIPGETAQAGPEASAEASAESNAGAAKSTVVETKVKTKLKFCGQCGKPFAEAALFCIHCGAKRV
ncbi:zinc ribbon domain-containing protein [Desulfitibacter alkalitolerans]|uniref:zinc ribbon domain-containing protein n=1 Tax=Desulfitibacter alkalitolerans TaxID=264641 RepID=UPI0004841E70|nr:zinc ribbon domain-containing protein [Desulfitibacter alkalitolerans]